jgi:hypothetical protein
MTAPRHDHPITMREAELMLRTICDQLDRLRNNTNHRKGMFEADLEAAATNARLAKARLGDRIHAQLVDANHDKELNRC